MAVCCQNLKLGALNSRSVLSMLVGALFQKISLFLNTPRVSARQQYKGNKMLHLLGSTEHFYIVISYMYVTNNTKVTHCCFYMAKVVTRTRRSMTLYVQLSPSFKRLILEQSSQIYFMVCC